MLSVEVLKAAGIPLSGNPEVASLYAQAALEWMQENTTLHIDMDDCKTIEALPACAKLFVVKYAETFKQREGVASQSIEGLSQSFNVTADKSTLVLQLARSLLGAYLKSQVRIIPAVRRW